MTKVSANIFCGFVWVTFVWLGLRHNPLLPMPPSVIRQWICGFHLRSLPKVCRTQMTPGVKSSDLLSLWNMRKTTLRTAEKRQFKRVRSSRKNCRRFSSMVKTQCRWLVLIILNDMAVVRLMEYLLPQENRGMKRWTGKQAR